MIDLSPVLQTPVEAICARGCTHVREVIRELEADRPPRELALLDADQRRRILQELQAIMAVYDAS